MRAEVPVGPIHARTNPVSTRIRRAARSVLRRIDFRRLKPGRDKVVCIGANKTGTTSMEALLSQLGYRVAPFAEGELLLHDWARRDFRALIRLCRRYDAFQDIPFSYPDTYRALDEAFPSARFILTVRDSPEQWLASMKRFHTRIVGKGRLPTADDLRAHTYRYKGYLWDAQRLRYGIDDAQLYDETIYKNAYLSHTADAKAYFAGRPEKLLVVNLADSDALDRILSFLGVEGRGLEMPHLNRSG
jgi:hypothetical protein